MKEATGELNATVVVVVAVGILSAFFYLTIWPAIKSNMDHNTKCSKAICNKCSKGDGTVSCYYCDNGTAKDITCPFKGVEGSDCNSIPRVCN